MTCDRELRRPQRACAHASVRVRADPSEPGRVRVHADPSEPARVRVRADPGEPVRVRACAPRLVLQMSFLGSVSSGEFEATCEKNL